MGLDVKKGVLVWFKVNDLEFSRPELCPSLSLTMHVLCSASEAFKLYPQAHGFKDLPLSFTAIRNE